MIICEIGMNHLGDQAYAEEYIKTLLVARPDAVTFQVREKSRYEGEGAKLKLPDEFYRKTAKRLKDVRIKFGMAIADQDKISFFEEIETDFYKVLSKDITNSNLVNALLETGKPVFVSTGMSGEDEIGDFVASISKRIGQVTLIHTQLTHQLDDVNLKAISLMREKFGLPIAFGSHTLDKNVLFLALAFEPSDIFFYVKGQKPMKHSDDQHAIRLDEVDHVIQELRELTKAIGQGTKFKMENLIKKEKQS